VEWIDGLREKSSRSDSNIINQDIIGAKWILRRRGHLPNTYNLLELMVKRPNRILSILQQHKLKVYELPVRCLNECVSKVILYWLRQCKIFENSRYQGWNRSQAICFNLILTYYGIILPSITSDKFLLHMRDTFQFAVRKKSRFNSWQWSVDVSILDIVTNKAAEVFSQRIKVEDKEKVKPKQRQRTETHMGSVHYKESKKQRSRYNLCTRIRTGRRFKLHI